MNQCSVPNSISLAPDVPTLDLDYEVAELTWENGQLALHSLGTPRVPNKPQAAAAANNTWDKPRAGGTLESIVNQATLLPHINTAMDGGGGGGRGSCSVDEAMSWFDHHSGSGGGSTATASASATMTMDALVPCSNNNNGPSDQPSYSHVLDSGIGTCAAGCSTRVGSCSGAATFDGGGGRVAREWSRCRDQSVSLDTCEIGLGVGGFTSTSMGSPGNTSSGKQCTKSTAADDHDSVCHSKPQREAAGDEEDKKKLAKGKSPASNKRSRAAAIHNQSERKRRDKINQRIKTLQKLVPNSSKTDKASMLDEVIEYLKQLQAQIQMMSRMNMSPMMLPMAMQQQLQMSMMAPMMGMGMGMGMGVMDINSICGSHPNVAGVPPVLHPTAAFMPMTSLEGAGDPLSSFLACQSQPMTMDAYSRMAAMYQQMHQPPPAPTSKN